MRRGAQARGRGFTLIELAVTLTVLAIILALGVPGLMSFVVQSRMTSQANELLSDISYARSEAATRGYRIGFCASANPTATSPTCSSNTSDWANGRIIFVDVDGDGQRSTASGSTEVLLRASPALSDNSTLTMACTGSGCATTAAFQFRPYGGMATSGNAMLGATGSALMGLTFTLCSSTAGASGRKIALAMTGRPLISKVSC
jgi:type IV fimbrial biogenesis protein FimT